MVKSCKSAKQKFLLNFNVITKEPETEKETNLCISGPWPLYDPQDDDGVIERERERERSNKEGSDMSERERERERERKQTVTKVSRESTSINLQQSLHRRRRLYL